MQQQQQLLFRPFSRRPQLKMTSDLARQECTWSLVSTEALGRGTASLVLYRRTDIDTEEVIDLFAAKKARRLNLIL